MLEYAPMWVFFVALIILPAILLAATIKGRRS